MGSTWIDDIFVEKELATHVIKGMEGTTHDIVALKIELQKTKHSYESVKKGWGGSF